MESLPITPTYSMTKQTFNIIFIVFAVLVFCALINHVLEVIYPDKQKHAIITLIFGFRHILFIIINGICIYGILKRPAWFTWFAGLLTLQQWYSNGSYAIEFWKKTQQVHWISIGLIILFPLLVFFLILEKKSTN